MLGAEPVAIVGMGTVGTQPGLQSLFQGIGGDGGHPADVVPGDADIGALDQLADVTQ
jgi:hypothetical protein